MRIELHAHTDRSPDALTPAAQIGGIAQERGVDLIVVCDHDLPVSKELLADPRVVPAVEVATDRGDLIGVFVKDAIRAGEAHAVIDEIHNCNGLVLLPHPFRTSRANWDDLAESIDLVEIHNSRLNPSQNRAAADFAIRHRLPGVVGSDAHGPEEIGLATLEIEDVEGEEQLKDALVAGRFRIARREYTPRPYLWRSKRVKDVQMGRRLKWLYHALREAIARVTDLPARYPLPPFMTDDVQERLDARFNYGPYWFWRFHHRQRIDHVAALLAQSPSPHDGARALDIGCGRGVYTSLLAQSGYRAFGLDLSPSDLAEAVQGHGVRVFSLGDAQRLPFPNGSFDLVICSEVLEHLPDAPGGALEIARVLRPGGRAIVSMPNAFSYLWIRGRLLAVLGRWLGRNTEELWQHTRWPFWRIGRLLEGAGLTTERIGGTFLLPAEPVFLKLLIARFTSLAALLARLDRHLARWPILRCCAAFHFRVVRKQ